jgi:hypothetical protein
VKTLAQSALALLFVGVLGFMATGAFAQSLDPVAGAISTVTELPSTITGTGATATSTGATSTVVSTASTVVSTASAVADQAASSTGTQSPPPGTSPAQGSGSPGDESGEEGPRNGNSTAYHPGMTCGEAARDARAFAAWIATFKEHGGTAPPAGRGSGIAGASAQGAAAAATAGLESIPGLQPPGEDGLRRILEILALATVGAGLLAMTAAAASFLTGRWSP